MVITYYRVQVVINSIKWLPKHLRKNWLSRTITKILGHIQMVTVGIWHTTAELVQHGTRKVSH